MKLTLAILSVTGLVAAGNYGYSSSNASSSSTSASASASATPSAAPSATSSSNIPSNISSTCSNFLTALNSAPAIQDCVEPVLDAIGSSDATSIASICTMTSSSSCSDFTMRTWLAYFGSNCTAELVTSPNQDVVAMYSVLYALKPFLGAVCAKDVTGQYCISGNSTAQTTKGLTNSAQVPLTNSDGSLNTQSFNTSSVLWLGANSRMNASTLCTTCTRNVLTSYIEFETSTPSVTTIKNLPLLASQIALWSAVQTVCPANFISGTLVNAGTTDAANGASTSLPAKAAMVILAVVVAGVTTL